MPNISTSRGVRGQGRAARLRLQLLRRRARRLRPPCPFDGRLKPSQRVRARATSHSRQLAVRPLRRPRLRRRLAGSSDVPALVPPRARLLIVAGRARTSRLAGSRLGRAPRSQADIGTVRLSIDPVIAARSIATSRSSTGACSSRSCACLRASTSTCARATHAVVRLSSVGRRDTASVRGQRATRSRPPPSRSASRSRRRSRFRCSLVALACARRGPAPARRCRARSCRRLALGAALACCCPPRSKHRRAGVLRSCPDFRRCSCDSSIRGLGRRLVTRESTSRMVGPISAAVTAPPGARAVELLPRPDGGLRPATTCAALPASRRTAIGGPCCSRRSADKGSAARESLVLLIGAPASRSCSSPATTTPTCSIASSPAPARSC